MLTYRARMSFHELATDAAEHGSLSTPAGWVEIVRRERGRATVETLVRSGFGSHPLEEGIPSGGTVKLDHRPEGLECRMCLPLVGSADQGKPT